MLVRKSNITAGEICSFKLVNGDEIIAKVEEVNDDGWFISKPFVILPNQNGIGIMPAMFSADFDKAIPLNKSHVMIAAECGVEGLKQHYVKTTTGIDVPQKGKIIV